MLSSVSRVMQRVVCDSAARAITHILIVIDAMCLNGTGATHRLVLTTNPGNLNCAITIDNSSLLSFVGNRL